MIGEGLAKKKQIHLFTYIYIYRNTNIKYSTDFNDNNMFIIKNISKEICPIN